MNEELILELIRQAHASRKNAYAPYSKYTVGCAVMLQDGRVITGVNIENASYPVGICAERAAMAQIVTEGLQHQIKALAVVTKSTPPGSPCGMCRQFLCEFLPADTTMILANADGEKIITTMGELLPRAFDKNALI